MGWRDGGCGGRGEVCSCVVLASTRDDEGLISLGLVGGLEGVAGARGVRPVEGVAEQGSPEGMTEKLPVDREPSVRTWGRLEGDGGGRDERLKGVVDVDTGSGGKSGSSSYVPETQAMVHSVGRTHGELGMQAQMLISGGTRGINAQPIKDLNENQPNQVPLDESVYAEVAQTERPRPRSSVRSPIVDRSSPNLMSEQMDISNQAVPKSDLQSAQETDCFQAIKAAVKLQKVYRSYRTRRQLADSALAAEGLWWQAIDYARLNHSTVAFFDFFRPEKPASRWSRISRNASKVGKGLIEDGKAKKLDFQHWIEAIDPRHRYGHNLHIYFDEWCRSHTDQPFFYWLDVGDGKGVSLNECPRSRLLQECITYLGPQERECYEYIIVEGELMHKQTGHLLDTNKEVADSKWIFVMSTAGKLYAGEKKKGRFHHSSFLAGGATLAAGRLTAERGKLKSISAYSGHYRPTDANLSIFLTFLQNSRVNLEEVQVTFCTEYYQSYDADSSGGECKGRLPTES
ncbi:IQ domain-containing protein IQM3 [Sesamum alatum]|uniref:IQ domain-containing protein IQM3 n=1 Tax=Sesamum alatum TaxID=300844 RepID=A0AAE2CSS1_9LAMI|nr:IQ domain-containing protein IQM3 [Sesamum alatum]